MGGVKKRGRPQELDVDAMMLFALLLERVYGTKPKPAARAAILAYFTWNDEPHPERQVDVHMGAVQKAVQRFKAGRRDLQPMLLRALGLVRRDTGERAFGTPQEMAAGVATFLPRK